MKLTPVQREVLLALVDLYCKAHGDAVKGESIADIISKNPGTIRNQMQSLRSLGLVEGVPGPKGGYRPTVEGYRILNFEERIEDRVNVPVVHKSATVKEVTVTKIELPSISSPTKCGATIHLMGTIKTFNVGDILRIGPTPVNKLIMRCKVIGRDDIDNVLLVDVLEMTSIPKEKVMHSASKAVTAISPGDSVKKAAKVFAKAKIRGAPVMKAGQPVGIISTVDITRALAEDKEGLKVKDIMSTEVHKVKDDALLSNAIEEMENYNISRLLIVNKKGDIEGIITRTDILCRIVNLCGLIPSSQ